MSQPWLVKRVMKLTLRKIPKNILLKVHFAYPIGEYLMIVFFKVSLCIPMSSSTIVGRQSYFTKESRFS